MNWLLGAIAGFGFVEVLLRLPLARNIAVLRATTTGSLRVLRSSRISDHWKERAMSKYAGRTMTRTLAIGGIIFAALLPALLCVALSEAIGTDFASFSVSWMGLAYITVVSMAYAFARVRMRRA